MMCYRADRTAFKTPISMSSYRLVYGKVYHPLIELEQKAYWAMKVLNFDLREACEERALEINEMDEFRNDAYESV